MPNLMTVEEVAKYLHVKKGTIYTWVYLGKLKKIKAHGRLLFDEVDVVAILCKEGE